MEPTKAARLVRIASLIPFLAGKGDKIVRLEGRPKQVLARLRSSCEYKDRSAAAWARGIESHCPLPLSHPYRTLCRELPPGHPLRTLGSWAYGAGSSWITIDEIVWTDGSVARPQAEHRNWLRLQFSRLIKAG